MWGFQRVKQPKKRVLSIRDIDNINSLEGKRIASSGSEEYTINILKEMFSEGNIYTANFSEIIVVPKDIDALMAVGFGITSAALTTENSFNVLEALNPKQHKKLRVIGTSKEILLPIVAVHERSDESVNSLLKVIEEMVTTLKGVEKLKMLGLDGWKEVGGEEREFLDK